MSWDGYIEHLMVELPKGGTLKSAAIIGQDGGLWAKSENFPDASVPQVEAIMGGFSSYEKDGHAGQLGTTGINFGSGDSAVKFQVAPGDETVLRGKSKGGGCCIKKSKTALVVGIYDEPVTPGDCNTIVENMGDYLATMEY